MGEQKSPAPAGLLPHHRLLLADSKISEDVVEQRGYWSAAKPIELRRLGFSTVQAIVPSLVIPIRGIDGELVSYQARPDQPRIMDGKPVKYESPAGSVAVLDVPAGIRDRVRTGVAAVWITEGARKADAAVSAGLVCVSLPGVWSWVRKIGHAKTVLPDLLRIKFTDRKVVIAFDSDVMVKPEVHAALEKLAKWLEAQGAWVHSLYLPHDDDEKLGLDDALASGYTIDRLWEDVEQGVRPLVVAPKETVLPTVWLLERIENLLRRFVKFTDERGESEIATLALYVLHTWALDAAHATPYLHVKSPAKRAGKTRLLEVLQLVCRDAVRASSITGAAVFQLVEAKRPTLLVDEVDTIFGGRSEYAEVLRGILNDGYKPGGVAIRGTQDGEPREFSTWSPKVLAGIENNSLPDTVQDRCIVISLERKLKSESVDRLREREVAESAQEMRDRLADWAVLAADRLAEYRVETIPEISDRAEDIWEPLLAIADDAGGDWPARARAAVLALAGEESGDEDHGLLLLAKLREMFESTDALTSKEICISLNDDPELPFSDYRHGDGMTAHALSKLLRPYGVGPQAIRIGQDQLRGYRRRQFAAAWERYLECAESVTSVTSVTSPQPVAKPDVTDVTDVTDFPHPRERPCTNGRHQHGLKASRDAAA
jgi:Protein of unknown function (DUF3631)/Domain of unknown function (DUF3854)